MTEEEFYQDALPALKQAERQLLKLIGSCPMADKSRPDLTGIQYLCSRIKSPDSMIRKLEKNGFPATAEAALKEMHDAVGVRIICPFVDDVYRAADWLEHCPELLVLQRKDYIAYPKPNGYRGYHLIVRLGGESGDEVTAEIQIRTIALDFWASLEHKMKYKKQVSREELIRGELKRCADEIASLDLSMQTIRDLLAEEMGQQSD